jgi:hypothetical protein
MPESGNMLPLLQRLTQQPAPRQEQLQEFTACLEQLRSTAKLGDLERLLSQRRTGLIVSDGISAVTPVWGTSRVRTDAADISAYTAMLSRCQGALSHALRLISQRCAEHGELDIQPTTAAAVFNLAGAAAYMAAVDCIAEDTRVQLVWECALDTGERMRLWPL